jgi:hypothetical protein
VPLVGLGHDVRRQLDGLVLPGLVVLVDRGLGVHEPGHADETLLLAERDGDGDDAAAERGLQRLQRAGERRAIAVHAVDDDQPRKRVLLGIGPDLLGLHLHSGHAVDDDDRAVRHPERGARLGKEIRVPGGIQEVDLGLPPLAPGHGRLEADLAIDLVGVEVGDRRPVLDATEAVDRAGVVQDGGDQGRLAAPTVADHGHVPDAGGIEDLHLYPREREESRILT